MGYEDSKIDFPCPECQQKFQVSLYQLFPEETVICPICGAISSGGALSEINRSFKNADIELLYISGIIDHSNCRRLIENRTNATP